MKPKCKHTIWHPRKACEEVFRMKPIKFNSPNRIVQSKSLHYGMPSKLFKDSDRDGVANVFDCKPRNKRRQDIMSPLSGSNPMQEMYARQESARQYELYKRLQEQEAKRIAEEVKRQEEYFNKMQQPIIIDRTVTQLQPVGLVWTGTQWSSTSSPAGQAEMNKVIKEEQKKPITIQIQNPIKYTPPKTPTTSTTYTYTGAVKKK